APSGRDGCGREKNAGSANSSAICATEDALSRRPVCLGGRGFVFQQPPSLGLSAADLTPALTVEELFMPPETEGAEMLQGDLAAVAAEIVRIVREKVSL
ncbi:MAG: hypothetical protein LLG45_00915, partial [Actinomycetia bacterium]|nr:hypothetical protein [Actinomycetes bacterium]